MEFTGDLRGMDFSGSDLSGVLFREADLYQASFVESNLAGATFLNSFAPEASFQRANCQRLRGVGTNFYRSDFRCADLQQALLWECVLVGCDLRGAALNRLTLTLDCNTFEETRIDAGAGARLGYLFARAHSPQQQRWLELLGERERARLSRVFAR